MNSNLGTIRNTPEIKKLLVEGQDDVGVFAALFKKHNINALVNIEKCGGVEALLETIPVALKGSGLTQLGVVVDADLDVKQRWNSISRILMDAGYSAVPQTPSQAGTIIKEHLLPDIGIWIMPDNSLNGILEDFVRFLIPKNDPLWPYTKSVIRRVKQLDQRFINNHSIKAKIHSWLAWQREPGLPMGLAITRRYLDTSCTQASTLVSWLDALFN